MNRRNFNKTSIIALVVSLLSPLFMFAKSKTKEAGNTISKVKKRFFEGTHLDKYIQEESIFKNYLKSTEAKSMLNNSVEGTVCEYYKNKVTDEIKFVKSEDLWHLGKTKREQRKIDKFLKDHERKCYLVHYMQIEFEYDNNNSYLKNKHEAFKVLSDLFQKSVDRKLIGIGCYGECFSMTVQPMELNNDLPVKREMLFVWPVCIYERGKLGSMHTILNDELGIPVFCEEGAKPNLTIKLNGKLCAYDTNDERGFSLEDKGRVNKRNESMKEIEWWAEKQNNYHRRFSV